LKQSSKRIDRAQSSIIHRVETNMVNKMTEQIIFKATVYRDATDHNGEVSKQPFSLTLYSDRSFITRWCNQIVERGEVIIDKYHPEERLLNYINSYLADEIKKLFEGENNATG
jgi:hypothetical protein